MSFNGGQLQISGGGGQLRSNTVMSIIINRVISTVIFVFGFFRTSHIKEIREEMVCRSDIAQIKQQLNQIYVILQLNEQGVNFLG